MAKYRPNSPSTPPLAPLAPPDPSRPGSLTIIGSEGGVELDVHDEHRNLVLRLRMSPATLVAALARYGRQPVEIVQPTP